MLTLLASWSLREPAADANRTGFLTCYRLEIVGFIISEVIGPPLPSAILSPSTGAEVRGFKALTGRREIGIVFRENWGELADSTAPLV